jgi:hypothetical protein
MNSDRILALLGYQADVPSVEAVFADLDTRRRPALDPEDRDAFLDWVLVRRKGVELGFVDEVFFQAGTKWKRRRKDVPLVLWQVYFYTARKDIADFTGKLPFGLCWSNDRNVVRQKLAVFQPTSRLYLKDTWDVPGYRLIVDYKQGGKAINTIVCQLQLHPWPEEGRIEPSLSVADWLSMFGLPATSTLLRDRLRPLDLEARIEAGEEREVDFIFECGLQIFFTESKELRLVKKPALTKMNEPVLGAVRFLRSRELDGRKWKGELPFRLSFDDTQQRMLDKIGLPPDEQEDEDFDGFALWHFPEFSLHVLYSNMENQLLRVTFMAPGY